MSTERRRESVWRADIIARVVGKGRMQRGQSKLKWVMTADLRLQRHGPQVVADHSYGPAPKVVRCRSVSGFGRDSSVRDLSRAMQ